MPVATSESPSFSHTGKCFSDLWLKKENAQISLDSAQPSSIIPYFSLILGVKVKDRNRNSRGAWWRYLFEIISSFSVNSFVPELIPSRPKMMCAVSGEIFGQQRSKSSVFPTPTGYTSTSFRISSWNWGYILSRFLQNGGKTLTKHWTSRPVHLQLTKRPGSPHSVDVWHVKNREEMVVGSGHDWLTPKAWSQSSGSILLSAIVATIVCSRSSWAQEVHCDPHWGERERERFCEFMWARYGPVSTNLWGAMEVNPRDSRLHICVCVCERERQALPVEPPSNPISVCRLQSWEKALFLRVSWFFILFATTFSYFGDFCTFAIPEESDSKIQELE